MIDAFDKPICRDARYCFAESEYKNQKRCQILTETYSGDQCPFCKPKKEETDGKKYPYDPFYCWKGMKHEEGKGKI